MKTYENTRTGAVIMTASVISGEDWKEVKAKKPRSRSTSKKDE